MNNLQAEDSYNLVPLNIIVPDEPAGGLVGDVPYNFVGTHSDLNIIHGPNDSSNTYGSESYSNIYGSDHSNCVYGPLHYANHYGSDHYNNTYGSNVVYCNFGPNQNHNTFGDYFAYGELNGKIEYCTFGNHISYLKMDEGCKYVQVGDNCTNVSIYNCHGDSITPFIIPAGSNNVTYRNNALVSTATGGGSSDGMPNPPSGYTGLVAPYYIRTQYINQYYTHVAGNNQNRVVSEYDGGGSGYPYLNFRTPNGTACAYAEYVTPGQVWHMKPLWCKQIRYYTKHDVFAQNRKISVRKMSDPDTVIEEVIVYANGTQFPAGGADHWTPDYTFYLPNYDSYMLVLENIATTNPNDGSDCQFYYHGDVIIN